MCNYDECMWNDIFSDIIMKMILHKMQRYIGVNMYFMHLLFGLYK